MKNRKKQGYIMAELINGKSVSYEYPGQREELRNKHKIRMKRHELRKKRKRKK